MDILIVVAEIFSEERQPAHMEGVFCHGKAEAHGTFVIQFQFADTDIGAELKESIRHLENLLAAYMDGTLVEKSV